MSNIITVNNVEGSHNELIKTNINIKPIKTGKKISIPLIKQHITKNDDINKAQPSILYPPYQSKPDDLNIIQGNSLNRNNNE